MQNTLPWCCHSSAALSVHITTLLESNKLYGVYRRGGQSAQWMWEGFTATRLQLDTTPWVDSSACKVHFEKKKRKYQLLLLRLSLELLLWPSGISLGFWCHAWGWCDSPAWMAEEMSDSHLCSTLETKKEENLLREMPNCSFHPNSSSLCAKPRGVIEDGSWSVTYY